MDERFYLFIYAALPTVSTRPNIDDITGWLEENASSVGEPLEFQEGHLTKFFACILEAIQIDLLPLIGSSSSENLLETDYCCGSLTSKALNEAVDKLKILTTEYRDGGAKIAMSHNLDPTFFLQSCYLLMTYFTSVLIISPEATAIGYIE